MGADSTCHLFDLVPAISGWDRLWVWEELAVLGAAGTCPVDISRLSASAAVVAASFASSGRDDNFKVRARLENVMATSHASNITCFAQENLGLQSKQLHCRFSAGAHWLAGLASLSPLCPSWGCLNLNSEENLATAMVIVPRNLEWLGAHCWLIYTHYYIPIPISSIIPDLGHHFPSSLPLTVFSFSINQGLF